MKISTSGKLQIKKRPLPQWLTYYIFVMPLLVGALQTFFGIPSIIKYTIDAAWIVVVCLLFLREKLVLQSDIIPLLVLISIFIFFTFSVYLFNFQSPFYYLWGFRNNFRFYFAFIAFCLLFNENDTKFCLKFMDILFWINAVVMLFQFFVMGYEQDYLGGIFGVTKGVNGYVTVFMFVVITKSILSFMNGTEKTGLCFLKCACSLVCATLAELKIFFFMFILILFLATILTSFSWRKFALISISALLVMALSSVLISLFGFRDFMTIEGLMELATKENYASDNDLNRFAAIPKISEMFLKTIPRQLFGMGLGNCDASSFDVCNTPFYQTYSYLHYFGFSCAFLFIEMGYVGIVFYLSFFLITLYISLKNFLLKRRNRLYCQMGIIISIFCFVLFFYNASLRAEIGYLIYFVLALPFISEESEIQYQRRLNVHR